MASRRNVYLTNPVPVDDKKDPIIANQLTLKHSKM